MQATSEEKFIEDKAEFEILMKNPKGEFSKMDADAKGDYIALGGKQKLTFIKTNIHNEITTAKEMLGMIFF